MIPRKLQSYSNWLILYVVLLSTYSSIISSNVAAAPTSSMDGKSTGSTLIDPAELHAYTVKNPQVYYRDYLSLKSDAIHGMKDDVINYQNDDVLQKQSDAAEDLHISIPPSLEEGPPKGELLFTVTHDPQQTPENLTILCKADGMPPPSFSWLKNGKPFDTEKRLQPIAGEGTIVISDPKTEDEGSYQCIASNPAGEVRSEVTQAHRIVTISFPKGEPRIVTAALGEPLQLTCDNPGGYPRPSLHWVIQHSDGSLHSVGSPRATVDDGGSLWFSSVQKEDASDDALYACAASSATSGRQVFLIENLLGVVRLEDDEPEPESEEFQTMSLATEYRMGNWVYLNVSAPDGSPDLNFVPETFAPIEQHVSEPSMTVLKGGQFKLFCLFAGLPTPQVSWWREDGDDIASENIVDFGKVLEFVEVTEADEGTYLCEASSEAGNGPVKSFRVNVESAPEFIEEPGNINQPMGESATFKCIAEGNPEPVLSWAVNGELFEDHHENTLSFDALEFEDKGVIACNASNIHGYVYSTGFLNVLSLPPEILDGPNHVSKFSGDRVRLSCDAYGAPDPTITWHRIDDQKVLSPPLKDDSLYEFGKDKIVIKSLSESTSGVYVCKATNRFNSTTEKATVRLMDSTTAEIDVSKERFVAGETSILSCRVVNDALLKSKISWKKNDEPLVVDSRMTFDDDKSNFDETLPEEDFEDEIKVRRLVIKELAGDDSGVYSCVASTEDDEAEDNAILIVEDVPSAPKISDIECAEREAYIHWTPATENNSPLQEYILQKQMDLNPLKWNVVQSDIPPSDNKIKVELQPGLTHVFRVVARNLRGESEPSQVSETCIAPGVRPDRNPLNVSAQTQDSSTISVSWEAMEPLIHNGPDFRYEVRWKPNASDEDESNVEDDSSEEDTDDANEDWSTMLIEDWEQTDAVIDGLRPHTEYLIRVYAGNEFGTAFTPDGVTAYTGADVPSEAPVDLSVRRILGTSVILIWEPVSNLAVMGHLKGYQIEVISEYDEESKELIMVDGDRSRTIISGLSPFTDYSARVRVLNDAFEGPFSSPKEFKTADGVSSPVTELEAKSLSEDSILVRWNPPEEPKGTIRGYVVRYNAIMKDEENPGAEQTIPEGVVEEGKIGGVIEQVSMDDEELRVKLSLLKEETEYNIVVFPRNGAGLGQGSEVHAKTESALPQVPLPPIFKWEVVERQSPETTTITVLDRDGDGDVDEKDFKNRYIFLADTDNDGDVDKDDVLDTDQDGDIDEHDFAAADIDNDGDVDIDDVRAADRDGDGDIDKEDIGDEDGDGDFDANDVIIADKDNDGDIDMNDSNEENVILEDLDGDGDIDEHDIDDVDGDGDIDEDDFDIADIDNDGDVDENDLKLADKDGDGDVDSADIVDINRDGKIDEEDIDIKDRDGDGDIDNKDFMYHATFLADINDDGVINDEDIIDADGDGDIDQRDKDIADIDNDGDVDADDIKAADRDGDGDVDAIDIGDEDGDGDVDGTDLILADEDGDGDIDAADDDEENVIFEDIDGDGDVDEDDLGDVDGDGDVDEDDKNILDVDDDGDIDADDMKIMDKDGDGDVDGADFVDIDGDGKVDESELEIRDVDADGDVDAKDIANQHVILKDTDNDGDIDINDVLDTDGDGDIDQDDIDIADIDDDGDVDADDLAALDRDNDGDIDSNDVTDFNNDGKVDEVEMDVYDRDGDGDVDETDYIVRKVFIGDTDRDGDIDEDDILDIDGDGDIDKEDLELADIDNDGDVDEDDLIAGDVDQDGDVDFADIGDEDNDGDVDADDLKQADADGDGDIDSDDDDGEEVLLSDRDGDGDIDTDDLTDVDNDGDVDQDDFAALDIDNDGDVDKDDLLKGDTDKDGDIDAADIVDMDGDGDVDAKDLIASDRDGDGDIDEFDTKHRHTLLADVDNDGDIDMEDVLDTDGDGDIDQADIDAADVNNDGIINIEDILAGDADGDGDIDQQDISDVDGDGDIDGDDLEASDRDGDGDIDAADSGNGVDIQIDWQPAFEGHAGSEFYMQYRPKGSNLWRQTNIEKRTLRQTLRQLDPFKTYELRMVAKDRELESLSEVTIIGPLKELSSDSPTVGAVLEPYDPFLWTWFVVAILASISMILIILFSAWVYQRRVKQVSELRAQLYEGYSPPPVVNSAADDIEKGEKEELDELDASNEHRQQMAALMRRQETIQSVDSFASHDDDFAEYGDETMAIELLNSVNLLPSNDARPE